MKALYHLSRVAYANFLWSVVERIKTPVRQRSSYPLRGKRTKNQQKASGKQTESGWENWRNWWKAGGQRRWSGGRQRWLGGKCGHVKRWTWRKGELF